MGKLSLTGYAIAVLEDTIRILELLQQNGEPLSLAQITDRSGLVKNKVFRILFTLEKHRLVGRDEIGRYCLGLRFLEFGQRVQSQAILLEASRPVMDQLVEETGESIFLGVVDDREALCVAARESPRSVRLFAKVGQRAPLHQGGVPKTLFAFLPGKERLAMLDRLCADSESTIDRSELEQVLTKIREQGYAVVVDELDKGAHSIAAPIHNAQGQVVAAISIAGPSHRFPESLIERYIQLVLEASAQISRDLGYGVHDLRANGANVLRKQ